MCVISTLNDILVYDDFKIVIHFWTSFVFGFVNLILFQATTILCLHK